MKMNNISFGAKLPVATCQIYNKKTKEFDSATVFEHDCKDSFDVDYFRNAPGKWKYQREIAEDAEMKFYYPGIFTNSRFYSIENEDQIPIRMIEFDKYDDCADVQLFETKQRNKYKYTGSNLLATIAKEGLKEGKTSLIISDPVESAMKFYEEKCGFKRIIGTPQLELDAKGMEDLISKTENKTQGNIIDLRG